MTRLSVNINKIATLRNARGGNNPDVVKTALDCERFGAEGITVHPRPDERHIRYADVMALKDKVTTEFNIEGYPDVGGLFRDTSEAETGHAFGHLDFLKEVGDPCTNQPIGDTEKNLKSAVEGETYEYTEMYPGFAKTARDEGFDEIGQELTALRLNIEQGAAAAGEAAYASCREAQARVNKLLGLVRELSLDLRPTMLDDLGLLPALLWQFDRYAGLSGMKVQFKHFGLEGRRFSPEIETAAYRIVQEAMTNVLRHSSAKEVNITVWFSDQNQALAIQIADDGIGFDVEASFQRGESSGLSGMRERAALLGGRFMVQSVPGEGTTVTAELPLGPQEERSSSTP